MISDSRFASDTISTCVLSAKARTRCAASFPRAISSAASRSRSARILAKVASKLARGRSVRFKRTSTTSMPSGSAFSIAALRIRDIRTARSELRISFELTEPRTSRISLFKMLSKRLSATCTPPVPTASRNWFTSVIRYRVNASTTKRRSSKGVTSSGSTSRLKIRSS